MNKKLILVISIIGVLILGTIALTFAGSSYANMNKCDKNYAKDKDIDKADSLELTDGYKCQSIDKPCFRYPIIEQIKGDSEFEVLEQTKLEPCRPKKVCPLCEEQLIQEKGEGHADNLPQTITRC